MYNNVQEELIWIKFGTASSSGLPVCKRAMGYLHFREPW
jgi:hypothetical protein